MNDIAVNIGQLVLDRDAIQSGDGLHLARMTEAALQRLLEQRGLPSGLAEGDVDDIMSPTINPPLSASDEQTAQELALALYWSLDRMR